MFIHFLFAQSTKNNTGNVFNCTPVSWVADPSNDQCTGEPYTGGVCSGSLAIWQECTLGQVPGAVRIGVATSSQKQLNDDVSNAITVLGMFSAQFACLHVQIESIQ